jgi:CheY-like chemotaxis protein
MSAAPLDSAAPFFYEELPARILLVEADVQTADAICGMLERAGHRVEVATDGQYALLLAADFSADLVLLDMGLEGTTSTEVAQVLKGAPALSAHYRSVPILYLAHADWLINQRFHQHPGTPMSDCIFKPVNEKLLLERVQRALEESRAG